MTSTSSSIPNSGKDSAVNPQLELVESELDKSSETDALAEELGLELEEAENEVIELEDGSVVINYMPVKSPEEAPDFYENLAEKLDEGVLMSLSQRFLEFIDIDREARRDRDDQYEMGIQRTGLGEPAPGGAAFTGAAKVSHPLLAEAVIDFAANASKELLPPDGIVKTDIKSEADKATRQRAERKAQFLNWQLDEQIVGYRDEMETLLSQVPLGGSQFLKWFYDKDMCRPNCEFIPADKIILPAIGESFYTVGRVTEVEVLTYERLQRRIANGMYRDVEMLQQSELFPENEMSSAQKANNKIQGLVDPSRNIDGIRVLYHIYTWLEVEADKESKGKLAPYILTVDERTEQVLALYRNWEAGDEKMTKLDWIVEFPFIKWRGILGLGLPHMIGGLSAAATGALRGLLDSAHANNAPAALKLKIGGMSGQTTTPQIGQVTEVETAAGIDDIRKMYMPLPFNPPSPVLFELLGWLTEAGKGVVSTSEEKIADASNQMPVGTAQALIEQGARVFSSIHARLHRAQARSLKILSRLNYWYLSEMHNGSGTKIEVRDFALNSDIRPVSDPNIFSEVQRVAQAQAVLQLSSTAKDPKLYDERKVHEHVLKSLKVPYVKEILPDPRGVVESNPALENVQMSMGQACAAFPDQDHVAHMITHFAYYLDPNYGGSPAIAPQFAPQLVAHLKQHLTLHYLASMKKDVEQSLGEDIFKLHEEKPLSVLSQQSLAMASLTVAQKNQAVLAEFQPLIKDLLDKVAKSQKARQENALLADPSAAVLLKTEQAKSQLQAQDAERRYKLEIEKLQSQLDELIAKHDVERDKSFTQTAAQIAIAGMNNAAKERVEDKKLGIQMDQLDMELQHASDMAAIQAAQQADAELRQHGLATQQQQMSHDQTMEQQNADGIQAQLQNALTAAQAQQDAQAQQTQQQQQRQHELQLAKMSQEAELQKQQQAAEMKGPAAPNASLNLGPLPQLAAALGAGPQTTPKAAVANNLLQQTGGVPPSLGG